MTTGRDPEERLPTSEWGQDHWSTLAYAETLMVELGGFQVGADSRMRTSRRNWRALHEGCPRPVRTGAHPGIPLVMGDGEGTRLRDGTSLVGHDDWDCLRDAAAAGMLLARAEGGGNEPVVATPEHLEAGRWLSLSERGARLAAALRAHKAAGRRFRDFVAPDRTTVDSPLT